MFSTPAKRSDSAFGMDPTPNIPTPASRPISSSTVIARGVRVEGEFRSQGDVVIEGEVQGSIFAAGVLTVGPEAKIKADISADEAKISGLIEGNLQITKQVVFYSSARINGDITAERITVESGAQLDGRIQIGPKPVAESAVEIIEEKKEPVAPVASVPPVAEKSSTELPPIIRPTAS